MKLSALGLGGHWKGLAPVLGRAFTGSGYDEQDFENIRAADFLENRDRVIGRAIELGVNFVDACAPAEILAYAKLLAGRRDKMHFGYSWHTREPRYPEWRTARALVAGLEEGLREAGLDYVDLWRMSLPADGVADPSERQRIEEAAAGGLALARRQGKARATGVSSHDRAWLAKMLEAYPDEIEVVLFPFTGGSARAEEGSLLDVVRRRGAGALAIKPFAGGALAGVAALAIRHIVAQDGLTGVLAGFASVEQLECAAAAADNACPLDAAERAELDRAAAAMWPSLTWLQNWRSV